MAPITTPTRGRRGAGSGGGGGAESTRWVAAAASAGGGWSIGRVAPEGSGGGVPIGSGRSRSMVTAGMVASIRRMA